ncbi:TonB family protein [Fibrobacter sp. UWB11]|uniref:TonB family protein n=1 Tax=Fibrobacter sp. UWB11 TaxID=1896202 RepID=UPI0009284373|nr:TonB family protein [Fibrobacter sp. UWB11]SIO38295.1 TonB family C-terminal domain-containing protein [Fibrobacter sp. UWB11]
MKFVLALLLSLTAVLYAQSSSSLFTGIGEYLAELIGDDVKSNEFCKANTTGLNLLILDGYFVVDRHVGGRIASIEVDASSTRIFTSDISREVPVWARVYGVSQAPSDSVIAILKEMRKKNADKIDRDEINVSFPYQDESIYKYKKFFGKLKAAGFSKIRLLAKEEEFSDKVYKNLLLKKYSKEQIESWESSKHSCNKQWLHITDSKLSYSAHKPLKWDGISDPDFSKKPAKRRKASHVKEIVDKNKPKLSSIRKKYRMQAPRLKEVKNSEHPDAEIQYDIVVKFTIAPDGKISEIEVVSSSTGNEKFDKAICDAISTWTFDEADDVTRVTLPLKFDKK